MFLIFLLIFHTAAAAPVRHDIRARLDPELCAITAEDRITLPDGLTELSFSLRKGLIPSSPDGSVGLKEEPAADAYSGTEASGTRYSASPPRGRKTFVIAYSGTMRGGDGESAPDCSAASGPLTPDGCLLTPDKLWYPRTDTGPSFFRLTADLPAGYAAVSTGEGKNGPEKDGRTISSWRSDVPAEGLTLLCGKYKEYTSERQGVKLQALLSRPDEALSRRYLEAAGRYLDMYSGLLGRYPYGKFALAEGISESEFAQPSLAVLGPTALRSPSAARSALPGLMARSWFGGGVFPAEQDGGWSEGLS
ncbi:MAG TPA: hypothetical protein PL037_07055, partial [Elusimicrobiales bacterium]|nr:hypothetical protein [Elusimicrobiales bacterium]